LDTKQIQLEIRDNGQGIPKKRLKRVIEGARFLRDFGQP